MVNVTNVLWWECIAPTRQMFCEDVEIGCQKHSGSSSGGQTDQSVTRGKIYIFALIIIHKSATHSCVKCLNSFGINELTIDLIKVAVGQHEVLHLYSAGLSQERSVKLQLHWCRLIDVNWSHWRKCSKMSGCLSGLRVFLFFRSLVLFWMTSTPLQWKCWVTKWREIR